MTPPIHTERDTRHRCPGALIRHGAWRDDGVHLSDRDAQAPFHLNPFAVAMLNLCMNRLAESFTPQPTRDLL